MEYTMADPYLMRVKSLELQRHLAAISERQRLALLRNQSYRQEFLQLEAHMETSGLELIQKMEAWYGREIKSLLSLQEGNLSAGGDKEEGASEQMPQRTVPSLVPRDQHHPAPAFQGCPTPAVSATGGLGMQQEPPQPPLPESQSAGGESVGPVEGGAGHRDLAASREGSRQLISSAPDPKPGTPKEGQVQGSVPGSKPGLSNWWTGMEESSAELLVSKEEVTRSAPSAQQEWDRDAQAVEGSPLAPHRAQEEPSDCSAPDRDTEVLQTPLSHHALLLDQHRARPPEGVAEVSDNLLASGEEAQDSQALPVLREALPGERGDRSPVQGEESSCSLASIPTEGREGEGVARTARLTSSQEPGRDLSSDSSKANDSQEMRSETSSSSDGIVLPFSRTEVQKERVTAIKSKAFWGESDDSSSELEAALRPQTHSDQSGDFDDFYD